jgi:FkbM family methyltransferase
MKGNRWVRWIAKILGSIGRPIGLSQIPSVQKLYLKLAGYALPDKDVWVKVQNQSMLLPNPRRNVLGRMIYLYGEWEKPVTQTLREEVRPGMTVLDIGAHVGYYSLLMAGRVGKGGRVFAFEPNPAVRKYLERNVERNGCCQVTICPFALFGTKGLATLQGRDNLNVSLVPQLTPVEGAVRVEVFDRVRMTLGIDKVDLLKMDVEGAEMDILLGMREMLERDHPTLIIEVHTDLLIQFGHSEFELREYAGSFGYTVKNIWSQVGATMILCKQEGG